MLWDDDVIDANSLITFIVATDSPYEYGAKQSPSALLFLQGLGARHCLRNVLYTTLIFLFNYTHTTSKLCVIPFRCVESPYCMLRINHGCSQVLPLAQ